MDLPDILRIRGNPWDTRGSPPRCPSCIHGFVRWLDLSHPGGQKKIIKTLKRNLTDLKTSISFFHPLESWNITITYHLKMSLPNGQHKVFKSYQMWFEKKESFYFSSKVTFCYRECWFPDAGTVRSLEVKLSTDSMKLEGNDLLVFLASDVGPALVVGTRWLSRFRRFDWFSGFYWFRNRIFCLNIFFFRLSVYLRGREGCGAQKWENYK